MGLFSLRQPQFQLTGLGASPDELYDGSFIIACAHWWKHRVEAEVALSKAGFTPFDAEEVRRLARVPQPEASNVMHAIASKVSIEGRQSTAVLALAYAFAVVIEAASGQLDDEDETEVLWLQPRVLTADELHELDLHYSQHGWAREVEKWPPYWRYAPTLFEERLPVKAIEKLFRSLIACFDDQVDRWSTAEGFDLRRSIGAPDFSLVTAEDDTRLPNFIDLLFEWGGRLRLGERLVMSGWDLKDLRYPDNEMTPIDQFYNEALERYCDLASETNPVDTEILHAARLCTAWLGEDTDEHGQRGLTTAAIRGYLWRRVEHASGHVGGRFQEPELSQAVEKSLSTGEDRHRDESLGVTLGYAATQCMVDKVNVRFGSLGGLLSGPRSFEKALMETTGDFDEHDFELDEKTVRHAWTYGVCIAEAERVLTARSGETRVVG